MMIYCPGSLGSSFFNQRLTCTAARDSNEIALISKPSKICRSSFSYIRSKPVSIKALLFCRNISIQLMGIGLKDYIFLQLWLLFPKISRTNLTQPSLSTSEYYATMSVIDNAAFTSGRAETYFHIFHVKTTCSPPK